MKRFAIHSNPLCKNIVFSSPELRISLITPCLIRVERAPFTDLAIQSVWNRDFGYINSTVSQQADICSVTTKEAVFRVNTQTGKTISVTLSDGTTVTNLQLGCFPTNGK